LAKADPAGNLYGPPDPMVYLKDWPAGVALVSTPEVAALAATLGIRAYAARTRHELEQILDDPRRATPVEPAQAPQRLPFELVDLRYIAGQREAKRALEIAAAGGHHLMFIGPPGTGKTLLAKAFPTITPPLTENEKKEVTQIWVLSGALRPGQGLTERPVVFASPSPTRQSIAGGGYEVPYPGLVSLAHRGLLVADEFPYWPASAKESLRTAMQEGIAVINRANWSKTFPARFQLLATANMCPCGPRPGGCVCTPAEKRRYSRRLSGPIMDRIHITAYVGPTDTRELLKSSEAEPSATVRQRVIRAIRAQRERGKRNAFLTPEDIMTGRVRLSSAAEDRLVEIGDQWTGRSVHQCVFVARTIADLAGSEEILTEHIEEAAMWVNRYAELAS